MLRQIEHLEQKGGDLTEEEVSSSNNVTFPLLLNFLSLPPHPLPLPVPLPFQLTKVQKKQLILDQLEQLREAGITSNN